MPRCFAQRSPGALAEHGGFIGPAYNAAMSSPLTLRVFLSSPGDVAEERKLARAVMETLEGGHLLRHRVRFDIVAWDDKHAAAPMDARETPQASVNRYSGRPSDCDLTLVILWSRIGTCLPDQMRRRDGSRYESGTVWEFEDARDADKPVFVYRRTERPRIEIDDVQFEAVQKFFGRFAAGDGSLSAGINNYSTPAEFERLLRQHLEAFVGERLDAGGAPSTDRNPLRSQTPETVVTTDLGPSALSAGWWHTLPGILTAIAGVVSAIAALFVALNSPATGPANPTSMQNPAFDADPRLAQPTTAVAVPPADGTRRGSADAGAQTAIAGDGSTAVNIRGDGNEVKIRR